MRRVQRLLAVGCAILPLLAVPDPAAAQTGLVAAYGFNEGSGGTTADASGNGNTGTISGAAWSTSGRFGGALSFNGTSSWVTIPDSASLDLTTGMTVEAWVRPTATNGARVALMKERTTSGLSYSVGLSDGVAASYIRTASDISLSGGSMPANTWTHVAATYDGATLRVYVNGVQTASRAVTGAITPSTSPLRIGGDAPWGQYVSGLIDEVRVYNRARTPTEITTDMNTAVGGAAPSPDFSISGTPSSRSITQGSSTTYTVTVGALNGFSGPVSLSASGLPAGATAGFSPSSLTGSGSSTLTVTTSGSTPVASSTVTITGTSGTLARSTTATLTVSAAAAADFTITRTPASRTITQGSSTTFTVTIGAVNGFTGTVGLSATGLPQGATATFSPASITTSGTSTVTLATSASTPTGTPAITFTGTSGPVVRSTSATLTINPAPVPDFTISASPASRSVIQGAGTTFTVTIGALNGFTGSVRLSASGLPADVTASFSPETITASGTSTLTVTSAASTPTGPSTLTITGDAAPLTHAAAASLVVELPPPPDFTLAVTPGAQAVTQGNAFAYSVTITPANGFGGDVELGVSGLPDGATASFSPGVLGGSGTSTLTITTSPLTQLGVSTLAITGTSGVLARSASTTLVVSSSSASVISIDFVGTGTAMAAAESAGVVPVTNWNTVTGISRTTPLALVNSTGMATGATVTWASASSRSLPVTDQAGSRRMMRGFIDTTSSSVSTVTVAGLPFGAYDVYVYADGDNGTTPRTAAYAISGSGFASTTTSLTDAASTNFNATFTRAQNSAGNYVWFSVTGTGFTLTATPGTSTTLTRRAPVNGIQIVPTAPPAPTFALSISPAAASISPGATAAYTVTVAAANGFNGDVELSVAGLPAGATASLDPPIVSVAGTSALTVTTESVAPAGAQTLTITGSGGGLQRTTTAGLTLRTFTITGTVAPATAGAGATVILEGATSATAIVNAAGIYTFTNLPAGSYTVTPQRPSASYSPVSRSVVIGGSDVTGVDFSGQETTYSVSGTILPAAAGTRVALIGPTTRIVTADATGAFTFSGVSYGTYVVRPASPGLAFTPSSANVSVVDFDTSGLLFEGTTSTDPQSADAFASDKAKAVLKYLTGLPATSANRLISGQFEEGQMNAASIFNQTGKWVGIISRDYAPYLDMGDAFAATNAELIEHSRNGGLVTITDHANNPQNGGSAWNATADLNQIATPGTPSNFAWTTELDRIAVGLRQLQDNDVVVLFRPFHEMNGGWFWWGAKDKTAYKRLWIYTFEYLTLTKSLHNLLWVYSSNDSLDFSYYPGKQYVDVVGVDVYGRGTSLPQLSGYSQLATYGKPFAITEFGACAADTLETPSRCAPADMRPLIASIKANMPKTVYWLQWDRVMSLDYNLNVSEVLNDPWVVTRDEIVFPVPPGSVVVVPPSPPGGVDDQASPTSTDVVLRGGDFSRRLSRGNQPQP